MKKELKIKNRELLQSATTFKISRANIQLYFECPCCFYYDKKYGIRRPFDYPFDLHRAVDTLLKKEFDFYRETQTAHPIILQNKLDAVPFKHRLINQWRDCSVGLRYTHEQTNLLITGIIDDIWINKDNELVVIDYRATSQQGEIDLDNDFVMGYKRLIDVHQWLLRQHGFKVSNTGYFLYCNGMVNRTTFDNRLDFETELIPYEGNDDWVDIAINEISECLQKDYAPEMSDSCEHCSFARAKVSKMVVFI